MENTGKLEFTLEYLRSTKDREEDMDCSKKRCIHETAAMTGHSSDPAWCPIDLDDKGCRPGHCKHFEPKDTPWWKRLYTSIYVAWVKLSSEFPLV